MRSGSQCIAITNEKLGTFLVTAAVSEALLTIRAKPLPSVPYARLETTNGAVRSYRVPGCRSQNWLTVL
jgi:hypothetical protein